MFKYVAKQMKRSLFTNILFCLLLSLAGALLCLTAGLWFSAQRALRDIDEVITTIALPDFSLAEEDERLQEARALALNIDLLEHDGLLERDNRRIFNAFANEVKPIPIPVRGIGVDVAMARVTPPGFVAFAVTVHRMEYTPFLDGSLWLAGENVESISYTFTQTILAVNEALYIHPDLPVPMFIGVDNKRFSDGSLAFEEGGRYIVMGNLRLSDTWHMGSRLEYIDIAYPSMEIIQREIGSVYEASQLMEMADPAWGVGQWPHFRTPGAAWETIALAQPFDVDNDLLPMSWSFWGWGPSYTAPFDEYELVMLEDREYVRVPPGWVYLTYFHTWKRAEELNDMAIDEAFLAEVEAGFPYAMYVDWNNTFYVELPRDQFPIPILETVYVKPQDWNTATLGFLSLDLPLEEFITSPQWEQVATRIEANEISATSFPVITTNNPSSFFEFHQQRNLFYAGRNFTDEEIEAGGQVALVSYTFARHNDLAVGDVLTLELYNAFLDAVLVTYATGVESPELGDVERTIHVWNPTLYSPDLEVSPAKEFTIVGIYRTSTVGRHVRLDYVMPANAVIIPDASFGEVAGLPSRYFEAPTYVPLLKDALMVANGQIEVVVALFNDYVPGLGDMFIFFDQGYDVLVTILNNLLFGTSWIFVLASFAWFVVVFVFAMFYVNRKKKEAAMLYALGISRSKRTWWIFAQCACVILLAFALSLALALPLYGDIVEVAAGAAQEFTVELRDMRLSDAAETGLRTTIPIRGEPGDVIQAALIATGLLLVVTAFVSASATVVKSLSKKAED